MGLRYLFLTTFLTFFSANAQILATEWVKQLGGSMDEQGLSTTVDNTGNIYITGYFNNTVDFDPGNAVYNLTSNGLEDIFIVKLDASGNFLWASDIGGISDDVGRYIQVDADGNILITGTFKQTVDFDPGAGTANLVSNGDEDIFILKLDAFGKYLWSGSFGGLYPDLGTALTIDTDNDILLTGYFEGSADFDPGVGSHILTSNAGWDVFVLKLDLKGSFVWVKQIAGTRLVKSNAITLDKFNHIYLTGSFEGTTDFDPGAGSYNLTPIGNPNFEDVFILKMDSLGNFIWARQFGGRLADIGFSINTNNKGQAICAGNFQDTADFDPDSVKSKEIISRGLTDIFIIELDTNGSLNWVKQIGGKEIENCQSILSAPNDDIFITGYFTDTCNFDIGINNKKVVSNGNRDIFISCLDSNGLLKWVKAIGGSSEDAGLSITMDKNSNIYSTGYFAKRVDFEPNTSTSTCNSNGGWDAFILNIDQNKSDVKALSKEVNYILYPNPTSGIINIGYHYQNANFAAQVYNVFGELILSSNSINQVIDISNEPNGIYLVKIIDSNSKISIAKIIKE